MKHPSRRKSRGRDPEVGIGSVELGSREGPEAADLCAWGGGWVPWAPGSALGISYMWSEATGGL